MRRFEKSYEATPSDHRITVAKLPILIDRIDSVVARLEDWDIRVAPLGRLKEARRQLNITHKKGAYDRDKTELAKTAEAVRIAKDFSQIIQVIEDESTRGVAAELQHVLKGTLRGRDRDRKPYQFQSQFLFGADLLRAGLNPEVPSGTGKGPDFVVCPGTQRFAVEVKRPGSRRGVFDLLKSARDQIQHARLHGIVVLDLTDCLEELGLRRVEPSNPEPPFAAVKEPYRELSEEVYDVIWDDEKLQYRPGFSDIMGVWYIARGWRWMLDDLEAPQLFEFQGFHRMASTRGNLWYHLADEFHRLMVDAMLDAGSFINQADHEATHPIRKPFWEQ